MAVLGVADGEADRLALVAAVGEKLSVFVNHIPAIQRGVVIDMKAGTGDG